MSILGEEIFSGAEAIILKEINSVGKDLCGLSLLLSLNTLVKGRRAGKNWIV